MIITKQKDRHKILGHVKKYKSLFLLGCSECASLCGTGSEEALSDMAKFLKEHGKEVTGTLVPKTGCQTLGTKIELKSDKEACDKADAVISMSCGAGTQSATEIFQDKPVCPANDSLCLGNMTRYQMFDERCSLCGECVIGHTGGICPVTNCPKGILNGPCGGMTEGKCEVSSELECAWVRIYTRHKKLDSLDEMKETLDAKDWSAGQKPGFLNLRKKKEETK